MCVNESNNPHVFKLAGLVAQSVMSAIDTLGH